MADIDVSFYPKAPQGNPFLETATGAVNLARGAQAFEQERQNLVTEQVNSIVNGFSSLAAKPNLTRQDFMDLGQRLVTQGVISPEVYEAELTGLPETADPTQLRQAAGLYAQRALDAGQRFSAQFGTPTMVDQGNQLIPSTVSPLTGIHPIGSSIPKTLSPSELAAPATIGVTEGGQPIQGTTSQFLELAGVNQLTGMPNASPESNALMPLTPPPSAAPGVITTLPAGAVAAQEAVGRGAGEELDASLRRAANFQQTIFPLTKALSAIEALGPNSTGPGADETNQIMSFLQFVGVPGINSADVKNFDEAKKYLVQYVTQNADTATNDKLAAGLSGNASVDISQAANVDVIKAAMALARMDNAKARAFVASGRPDSEYTKWASDFAAGQDPRAYAFDLMTLDARKKLLESMDDVSKAVFMKTLRTAVDLGLVTPPQGKAGG